MDSITDRGQVLYSPEETFEDALGGTFQGSNIYAALGSCGGSLILGGALTAGQACGRYLWKQEHLMITDE